MNGQKSRSDLNSHYTYQSDNTFCQGIFLENEQIIVPTTLQAEMKSLIHQEYLGLEHCNKNKQGNHYFGH